MESFTNDLDLLAARTGRGDPAAESQLRQQLEPQMVRIVSQALRSGTGRTPLARNILAKARQLAPAGGGTQAENRDRLIRRVARELCASVIDRLRGQVPQPRQLQDTLYC